MLSSWKYIDWSMMDHKDRDYNTEIEKRFFESVENPKPVTEELKELYRTYKDFLARG